MGAVIHGQSHKVLKHLRKPSAALAVYWLYCSRTNNEGVSWSSLERLAKDTGWSINSLTAARRYLVKHKALESVKKYVQPRWRKLPADELKLKLQLDRNEYFRPTGHFITDDGEVLPLLYSGGDAHPDENSDLSNCATSQNIQDGQNDSKLNTSIELDSSKDSASNDAQPEDKPQKPKSDYQLLVEAVGFYFFAVEPEHITEKVKIGQLTTIAGWLNGTSDPVGLGKLSHPATPVQVKAFAEWWDKNHSKNGKPLSRPRGVGTFITRWREWAAEVRQQQQRKQAAVANAPTRDEVEMTPQQKNVLREYLQRQAQKTRRLS